MKIEVWSDVACPFCYLGKKKLEKAIAAFQHGSRINIIWKSFQLNPEQVTDTQISLSEYLAREKNWTPEYTEQVNRRIEESGSEYGIIYNFNKAVPANTMKAHILLHAAKKVNKQNEVKEGLFRAYFTEGKNVDDNAVLIAIASEAGMGSGITESVFEDEELINEVMLDRYEATQLGIRGVPFFIFNNRYAISGAHPDLLFTETLQKSFSEWDNSVKSKPEVIATGDSCGTDGDCR